MRDEDGGDTILYERARGGAREGRVGESREHDDARINRDDRVDREGGDAGNSGDAGNGGDVWGEGRIFEGCTAEGLLQDGLVGRRWR